MSERDVTAIQAAAGSYDQLSLWLVKIRSLSRSDLVWFTKAQSSCKSSLAFMPEKSIQCGPKGSMQKFKDRFNDCAEFIPH